MPKEAFAVKDPRGEIFYPSITKDASLSRLVAINRFWSSWDELVEAGWSLVPLTISEVIPS